MLSIAADWKERLTTPPDNWREGVFVNARKMYIHTASSLPEGIVKGQILHVVGMNENTKKSYELARDFNRHACRFDVFDRALQGYSGRILKNRFKIHSQGFDHDIADVIKYAERHMSRDRRVTMLGHSTGGLIALMAYHDRPDLFTPPFLNAPLLGMANPMIRGREEIFARIKIPALIQNLYIPGGKDWCLRGTDGLLPQEAYSSHPERMKLHDYFPERDPALRTYDPTIGWIWHVCQAITRARDPRWLSETGPVTIATAGRDLITDNDQVMKALSHMKNATHIHFENGRHESTVETDDIRDRVIGETLRLALNG